MSPLVNILEHAGLVLSGAVAYWAGQKWAKLRAARAESLPAASLLDQARREAEIILRDARLAASQEALRLHEKAEHALASRRTERLELERRLAEREALINSQLQRIVEAEGRLTREKTSLEERAATLAAREEEAARLLRQTRLELARLSGLDETQVREAFLKNVAEQARAEAEALSRSICEEAKTTAEEKARRIISIAIQRYAGDHTFQNTTAAIALPAGEDIKGRIIGREGRNIRAFEAATGVTVLIDDTPGSVLLSGFDPVRREIARETMAQLIADGRIHPTRIEETVARVTQDMETNLLRLGQEAVTKLGLPPLHPEVLKLLGRLHFRHSYAQNLLQHSIEVAHLMGLMAAELGLDSGLAKRAGLLHDIGKAVSHEFEGPHALVGASLIKQYGEPESVVNGVASHHGEVPAEGPLGILVSAADAVSASRPGARSENLTAYLKRVSDLEAIASAFPGVEKAFAMQAGRELRVFVQPDEVSDEQAHLLARAVALKIESQMQFPGQIRVAVIRERRCVQIAR